MKFLQILLFVALLPAAILIGCSSGPSEEDLQATVIDYSKAVESNSWEEVCSLVSVKSQQAIVDNSGQLTCVKGYQALSKKDQQTLSNSAKGATFVSSTVDGEKGTVTIKTANGTAKVPVIIEDGAWKVHLFK